MNARAVPREALGLDRLGAGAHTRPLVRRALTIVLCSLLAACVPGVHPRDDAGHPGHDAGAPAPERDGGASDDARAPRAPIDFEHDIVLDDDATRAIDARALPAGDAPCRAPALVWVERSVDGDTLFVTDATSGAAERVRMIGIDSPEVAHDGMPADCYGPEAAALTAQLEGHLVWLTFEAGCTDRYDRTLAHVHVDAGPAGSWARQLLRRGLARAFSVSPNREYERLFESDERAAQSASAGLWGACP